MKLKKILSLLVVSMLLLTGCKNDKKYNEMMDSGIQAFEQGKYEDALDFFNSAIEEKNDDNEASMLHKQVTMIMQAEANIKAKLYAEAMAICDEIMKVQTESNIGIDLAKKLKQQAQTLKQEEENRTFHESISKKIEDAKALIESEEYMSAKANLGYIIDEISGKADFESQLKECEELIKTCEQKIEEIAKKEEAEKKKAEEEKNKKAEEDKNKKPSNSDKNNTSQGDKDTEDDKNDNDNDSDDDYTYVIEFNDELKKQIAIAGAAYVEFYFEYAEGQTPSKYANQAYEDTENDTPLGEYKEEGRKIFVDAFKEAFEATGNEYY